MLYYEDDSIGTSIYIYIDIYNSMYIYIYVCMKTGCCH